MQESFFVRLDSYPPCLIRLLARHKRGGPLTTLEIAERSGLSPAQVEAISQCTDWVGIDVPTLRAFCVGCGIDLTNRVQTKRASEYLRSDPSFRYLKKDSNWPYYRQLIQRFQASRK